MDTVSTGVVKYLAPFSDVTALLGAYPASDSVNGSQPYLFAEDIGATIYGTGQAALVAQDFGTFQAAPPLSTPQFFRLAITMWVDPARDAAFNITESAGTTIKRARQLATAVNFHLQFTSSEIVLWGDLRVAGCQLLTGAQFHAVQDMGPARDQESGTTSHPQIGTAYYGVTIFGYTDQAG